MNNNIAREYELCPYCKNNNSSFCSNCTSLYGFLPITIYGVNVSSYPVYYHKYYEPMTYNCELTR